MAEIIEEPEQSRLVGVNISDLLNPKFMEKLARLGIDIDPASLLLISIKDDKQIPIALSHQNSKEYQDKILHISCPDVELFEKIKSLIKEI